MNHYYTNNKDLESKPRTFEYGFRGHILKFNSDIGVFSKDGIDFGTNLLLKTIPDLSDVKSVLDMGCGIGIIGICISKKYPNIDVLMTDVNDRAIDLANLNAKENEVSARAINSNMYENVSSKFDLIVTNPPIRAGKEIVHGIVSEGYNHLNCGGKVILVIQKKQGAESMKKKLEAVYGNVSMLDRDKGYLILSSVKNK